MRARELFERAGILYHVSETKNEANILQRGILRRDKDWPPHFSDLDKEIGLDIQPDMIYKQRIYLFGELNKSAVTDFMAIVFSERHDLTIIPDEPYFLLPFTVFAVDTNKLQGFQFHNDTASNSVYKSVWTDSADISPEAVQVYWRSTIDHSDSKDLQKLW